MTQKSSTPSIGQTLSKPSFMTQEIVRLLYMQAPISNSVVIVISALFYYLLEPRLDSPLVFVWLVLLLLSASYRLFLWYRQKNKPGTKSAKSWQTHYLIACGMLGVSWSLIYPFLYEASDPFVFPALMMLGLGVISSAVPILAPYMPAFIVYTYPQALMLIFTLLRFEDTSYHWLAFAMGIYTVMTTLFTRNANRTIIQSIKLQESNTSLISDLNNEVNQRESLIAQRTLELEQKNDELTIEINDKEEAETKLQQANADLAATLQAIPDLLFELDEKGTYIDVWAHDADLLAAQKETLIGHMVSEILPARAASEVMNTILKAAEDGTSHGQIFSLQLADGEHWFELSTSRKQTIDGATHFLMISRDITDKRQVESELEQHREQLEEKVALRTSELKDARDEAQSLSRVKTEFLANMSHKIRTPLNAVLGLAQIGERGLPAQKVQETFKQINSSGQHLLGVINDILDFSKLEAGKLVIESRPFLVIEVVNEVVELLSARAKAKNLVLKVNIDENLPASLLGDSRRLQQVLINLLSNAIKFTSQGEISLAVTRDDKLTQFQMVDSGIGMNQEETSRLFSSFEQADSSTTRKYGGTGLGLAISYNLAQLMNGNIEVESQPGVGSSFTLSLPLPIAPTPATPKQDIHQDTELRLNNLQILAAEDVEINRFVLQDLLEHEGASVVFAENGQQVLDQLEQHGASSFDVVLMDIQMPVMDGYEATRQVNRIAPTLPVIGLTAHALQEEQDKILIAGMLDHVTKPIETDVLVAAILRHVERT